MKNVSFPREVLLFEIERHCRVPACNARNLIGLTKQEAIEYRGFACFECKNWTEDSLRQTDAPDWWDDISDKTVH